MSISTLNTVQDSQDAQWNTTGRFEDSHLWSAVTIAVVSEGDGNAIFEWSVDGTNTAFATTEEFLAPGTTFIKRHLARYFRVRVEFLAPTQLSVQTLHHHSPPDSTEPLTLDTATTAFHELSVAEITPLVQLDGLIGVDNNSLFQKDQNAGNEGSQTADALGRMSVSTDASLGSFSALRSRRSARYRPGQGSLCRFTAMFPDGHVPGYDQFAGFLNRSDALVFGYQSSATEAEFSILRRSYGKEHSIEIEVTTAATGGDTMQLTLDDVVVNLTFVVNASGDTRVTAGELATLLQQTNINWLIDYEGSNVHLVFSGPPGPLTGAFNLSTTGTITATLTTLQNGSTPTDNWIPQSQWNRDPMNGTGPSRLTLDPSKLNVFQIDFQWLGVGVMRFSIESQTTGKFVEVHRVLFANQNTQMTVSNPSLRVGYAVVNSNPGVGTGEIVTVQGASIMAGVQGKVTITQPTMSAFNSFTANLSQNNTQYHMLSIKANMIDIHGSNNLLNQRELILLSLSAGIAAQSANFVVITLYKNANIIELGTTNTVNHLWEATENAHSISTRIDARHEQNSGTNIGTFITTSGSTSTIDLYQYRTILSNLDVISVFIQCEVNLTRGALSLNFLQD